MRLREFWGCIDEYGEPDFYNSKEDANSKYLRTTKIHVREVSPELDAAYAECEKTLERIVFEGKQMAHELAKKALAALKKARK